MGQSYELAGHSPQCPRNWGRRYLCSGSDFRGYCKMADLLNQNETGSKKAAKDFSYNQG